MIVRCAFREGCRLEETTDAICFLHMAGAKRRGGESTQAECVRALKGLVLPRASHSGEIALAGSRRLCSTLAAVPVLFAKGEAAPGYEREHRHDL